MMNQPHNPENLASKHRVLVTTIPKSGTYLMAEILKNLGLTSTGLHLFETFYTDYSQATLEESRNNPESLIREIPLDESLKRIVPGTFAVSHVACNNNVTSLTKDFKRIFLFRELRTCLVSHQRFYFKTKRGNIKYDDWISEADPQRRLVAFMHEHGEYIMTHYYHRMLGWLKHPGSLSIRYEDLAPGDEQSACNVELIAWYLDMNHINSRMTIENSLSTETLTKTSTRSQVEEYWSDEAENWFERSGGVDANTALGFPENGSSPFPMSEAAA